MNRGFFITATDTDAGKTWVSLGIIELLKSKGIKTAVMKPVSAGCRSTADGLRNEDAERLQQAANIDLPYEAINPYAYEAAIAPHIAALQQGSNIRLDRIKAAYELLCSDAQYIVVEGAGGWQVPINETQSMADVAAILGLPVVIVVAMKLGCLNHAILTLDNIKKSGLPLAGWVANTVDKQFASQNANIDTLNKRLGVPCLGIIPHMKSFDAKEISGHLQLTDILNKHV